MNKHLHRIIFNAKRGQRMAVAETASSSSSSSGSKGASGDTASSPGKAITAGIAAALATAALSACALAVIALFTAAEAQIVADPSASGNQRPTVLTAPNGVPLVNIQTPSAAGVSRNTYSQFDVNAQGAILNNARTNAQTQLGGWVQGNPWLAGGAARVILNEVNSSNPSHLRGFVEIAGSRAEVVIANPAGVNINGGGFINASRATITTGTPVMNGGNLEGYVVQKGLVRIDGAGLDASQTDYTGIIARAVEVNAGIWAKELKVTTGANQVDVTQSTTTPIAGSGAAPAFALDVSQLGGMYAGKITLVGTEAGVGVRHSGTIGATAGDVVVTTNGWLTNAGSIQASGNTSVTAQGSISHTGTLTAQGNTNLQAVGTGSQISAAAGSVLAAGLNPDGSLSSTGALSVTASDAAALNGQALAGGDMAVSGSQINLAGGQVGAHNIAINASAGNLDASRASVTAQGSLSASAAQALRTDGATVSAAQLNLTARDLSNVAGEIIQTGTGDTSLALSSPTGTINNSQGRIATNAQRMTLSAQTLNNQGGKIEHAGSGALAITATGAVDNTAGKIVSNAATGISAQSLGNQGGVIQTGGAASLRLATSAALDNSAGGQIAAGGSALIAAGSLNNDNGKVTAGADLTLSASQAIDNSTGFIAANGAVTVTAASLNNTEGTLASVQSALSLTTSGATTNNSGKLQAAQDVTLRSAGLSNVQGTISARNLSIQTQGQGLNNSFGTVAASGSASVQSGALNNDGGLLQSAGALAINTGGQQLSNSNAASHTTGQGGIRSQSTLTLATGDLLNTAGFIGAKDALNANSANASNSAGGQIVGESSVSLTSTAFDNRGGQVQALGDVSINSGSGAINNTASLIRSAGTTALTAGSVINSNTLGTDQGIEGHNVTITAASLANNSGAIRADNNVTFTSSGSLNNAAGLISAGNALSVQDTAASKTLAITNTGGTLIAGQTLGIDAASLSSDGSVLSQGSLSAKLLGDYTHSAGAQFQANGNASLETTGTLTNQGQLLAGQDLTLKAASLDNQASGEIRGNSVKLIATAANTLTNRGLIDGVETVIETVTLNNLGTGRIYGDHVAIGATSVNNLAEGGVAPVIAARNRLDIGATTINNSEHALIFSGGDMAIGGSLNGAKQATGQATTLNNGSATIESLGSLTINAAQINNINNHFSTQVVPVSTAGVTEYQIVGSGNRWAPGQISLFVDEELVLSTPEGASYWVGFNRYDYTRSISETQVASSDPGQILSGGAMTLNASSVFNDKSRIIAGGALGGSIGSLTNTEAAGERVTTDSGTVTNHYRIYRRGSDTWGTSTAGYAPANTVEGISLTPTVYRQNTAPTGTGTTLAGVTLASVSANTSAAGAASAAVGGSQSVAPLSEVIALAGRPGTGPATVVRTGGVNFSVPNNSLFRLNAGPGSRYLVETDPRFASYRTWLSSDYLLSALSLDPSVTQKRLGDGFYEQKLIREQVAQLTGRRFLANYQSDEAQYQALMQNAGTFAQAHQLVPGIALSAAQMAQLTSDIVWLVERDITLPDGTVAKALVPQLYVRVKEGDLTGDGALISASATTLNVSGDVLNSGTIAGRSAVVLNAQNVQNLAGRIRGADVTVAAANDLNNIGGQIIATDSLVATAGRDLNVTSTTRTQTGSTGSRTNIDRVAGLYVSNPGGTLVASAGRDANIIAGVISNSGAGGNTVIAAGNNLSLGTVTESSNNTITWNANNFRKDSQSSDVGSVIQGAGNVALSAGNDLSARAAQLTSGQGALTASAGNNVSITAGESRQSVDEGHQSTSKGFLSKKTIIIRETMERTDAIGSALSGNTVTVLAGKDINVKGSSAVSDNGTTLVAGNNLTIEAAQNTFSSTSLKDEKKSGIFSGGGLSITAGKQQQSTDTQNTRTTAAASTVGSIGGDVTLSAGEAYKQVGSDVLAPSGDISILAKKVDIIEARETSQSVIEQKFKQSGITLAITSPVISAIQTAQQMSQAASDTSDGRMQALAAANTAFAANNAANAIKAGQGTDFGGKSNQMISEDVMGNMSGRDASTAEQAGGINLSISIGGSKSASTNTSQSDTARGSSVTAGGNVAIVATGAGQDSNLTIQGSTVEAGKSTLLLADNQIRLLAARNESSQNSSNTSSSGSIGISFGTDGLLLNLSASAGKGQGNGADTSYTNTQIKGGTGAGNAVILQSGGDTTLKGAVVAANQVKADVGGNLNIESLQDSSNYASKQQNFGGSLSIGYGNMSGSVSASKSNINSNYQSVTQQSGIKAGDGGFQVDVGGNTDLKGAVIASTDKAVNFGNNTFTTGGTLTTSDIQNTASYEGKSVGISIGGGQSAKTAGIQGVGAGIGKDEDSASSTTTSGISGIAANTAVRSTDPETGIARIFDADKVQREINAQVVITQAFGRDASKAIGDYADTKLREASALRTQAQNEPDETRANQLKAQASELEGNWGDKGVLRLAAHTLVGGLTGGASGAAGAAVGTLTAPTVAQALLDAGITGPLASTLTALASTAAGAAVGGVAGGAAAANEVTNNYLKHTELTTKIAQLAACKTDQCKDNAEAYWNKISQDRNAQMKDSCLTGGSAQCSANIEQMSRDMVELQIAGGDKNKGYTGFTPEERNNIKQVMSQVSTNLEIMAALGNLSLGTTYSGPDELVAAGILSSKEGELLKSARLDNMVGFLGAVVLPSGVKGSPRYVTNKTSTSEFTATAGKPAPTVKPDGEFQTLGLNNVDPMRLPDGVKMVRELEKGGLSYEDAVRTARGFVSSGSTPPVATPIDITDKLVKVVPSGGQPSTATGYWMRESELVALQKAPASMANKLGLPPGMQVDSFDVFQITPRQGALVFESTIAPTTVGGTLNTTGGAKQSIVVDRNQFTPPVKIGSITVK